MNTVKFASFIAATIILLTALSFYGYIRFYKSSIVFDKTMLDINFNFQSLKLNFIDSSLSSDYQLGQSIEIINSIIKKTTLLSNNALLAPAQVRASTKIQQQLSNAQMAIDTLRQQQKTFEKSFATSQHLRSSISKFNEDFNRIYVSALETTTISTQSQDYLRLFMALGTKIELLLDIISDKTIANTIASVKIQVDIVNALTELLNFQTETLFEDPRYLIRVATIMTALDQSLLGTKFNQNTDFDLKAFTTARTQAQQSLVVKELEKQFLILAQPLKPSIFIRPQMIFVFAILAIIAMTKAIQLSTVQHQSEKIRPTTTTPQLEKTRLQKKDLMLKSLASQTASSPGNLTSIQHNMPSETEITVIKPADNEY